jgi:hypothetical protein
MEGLLVLLRPSLDEGVGEVNALKKRWHHRRYERAGTAPEPTYVIYKCCCAFLNLLRDNTKRDAERLSQDYLRARLIPATLVTPSFGTPSRFVLKLV